MAATSWFGGRQALRSARPGWPSAQVLHPNPDSRRVRPPLSDTTETQRCDSTAVLDTLTPHASAQAGRVMAVACSISPADSLELQRALTIVAEAIPLYRRLTGVPYPNARYVMQFSPGSDGARTNGGSGVVSFVLSLPDRNAERDRPAATAKILAHELAHQWGPRIKGPDTGWLGEGFADFLTAQVWAAQGGAGARGEEDFLFFYNTQWDESYRTAPLLGDLPMVQWGWPAGWFTIPSPGAAIWTESIDQNTYYRGALILWMLQQYLGDAHFWAAMHVYLSSPTGDDANAALLHAIQTVTGEDLTWFFQEWVHGHGYPRFTVGAAYDAAAHRVTLHVTQVAPAFRMRVAIRVGTPAGDVVTQAVVDAPTQTLTVEHVQQQPTFVVFDDGDAVVKTLTFPQPTAWLSAALQREARPWQTWWAIGQLQARAEAGDGGARAALMTVAQHGRYPLTRAQALIALQAPPPAAMPAVLATFTRGLGDTAVMVRRAAVVGLAHLNTPAAAAPLRRVVAQDASELVRAEALQRLLSARTTSAADRQTLFAQALQGPPGYLDLVPLSAFRALSVVGQCDSATVATVQTLIQRPGGAALVRRVTDQLSTTFTQVLGPTADPTCLQTFAAVLPLPGTAP